MFFFWFDDETQFKDEIDKLNLENVIIRKLTDTNWIYIKYLLEIEDKNKNYLVYVPFPQPEDKENNLADIVYYFKKKILYYSLNVTNKPSLVNI